MRSIYIGAGALLLSSCVAAENLDFDALQLADDTAPASAAAPRRDWRLFAEGMLARDLARDTADNLYRRRLSLDLMLDKSLAPHWRAVLANRLDLNSSTPSGRSANVNSLKEAYLSWSVSDKHIVDAGRINSYSGVAFGYNPTDYFKVGALRAVASIDPASLKNDRLGSGMLRGQILGSGYSVTALMAPKLANQKSDATFNPDFGATNNKNKWLISLSRQFTENLNPQFLLYKEDGLPLQGGLNITALANDATVVYAEWSGGRQPSLLNQALGNGSERRFYNRAATGLTYTAPFKLSLTLEFELNDAALDQDEWARLSAQSPAGYLRYRAWLRDHQELPTKQAYILFGNWQDALINHLDVSAMLRFNAADSSRLFWTETRYRLDKNDIALQWQINSGRFGAEYGAIPLTPTYRQSWKLLMRHYF